MATNRVYAHKRAATQQPIGQYFGADIALQQYSKERQNAFTTKHLRMQALLPMRPIRERFLPHAEPEDAPTPCEGTEIGPSLEEADNSSAPRGERTGVRIPKR